MKPSSSSLNRLTDNLNYNTSNIERATNFQNTLKPARNLQLSKPRILQRFNEIENNELENNEFKYATQTNQSSVIFTGCDNKTNNGEQCLNNGNLSVNNKNGCNNYCIQHSDKWIDSLTVNPYIVSDTNNNVVNSELVYDITVKTVGKSINQYLPEVTDINGKYKLDFKINDNLNLQTKEESKDNELVDEFLQQENKNDELDEQYLQNEFTQSENKIEDLEIKNKDKKYINEFLNIEKLSNKWINEYLKSINTTSVTLIDITTNITTNITINLFKNNYNVEYAFIDFLFLK